MKLEFVEELPGQSTGRYNDKYRDLAATLAENPGRWANVVPGDVSDQGPSTIALQIRNGTFKAFRPYGHFEATVRRGKLFARYVGQS